MAAVLLAAATSGADEIRRWKDAKGNLHYSIAGEGAETQSGNGAPIVTTRELSGAEKLSIAASLRRRELERELRRASEEHAAIRQQIEELEGKRLTVYSPPAPRDPEATQFVLDAQRDAFLAARKFERERDEKLASLRRRERQKLRAIVEIWDEFDDLRAEVRDQHRGKLPGWWLDRLACEGCRSREDAIAALKALRKRRDAADAAAEKNEPTPTPEAEEE